jgi:hypothetical protein
VIVYTLTPPDLSRIVPAFAALSTIQQSEVLPKAINSVGDRVFTAVKRTLSQETGMPSARVAKVLRKSIAVPWRPVWRLIARDRYTSLKDFRPSDRSGRGITASPWNRTRLFRGTFFGPGGHVYRRIPGRVKGERERIKKLYGPALPVEMIRGQAATVFEQMVEQRLPQYLAYQTDRAIGQVKARYRL